MTTRLTAAVIASALLLPIAGYTADPPYPADSPKESINNSVITSNIKTEMAKDRQVSAMKIDVETDNSGVVKLGGTAKSQAEADKAVGIARSVKGVTSVQNNIKITGGQPAGSGSKPAIPGSKY